MASKVTCGLIQLSNAVNDTSASISTVRDAMFEKHLPYIEEAGKKGVQILCLQELFNGPYFCPSQDSRWCDIAEEVPGLFFCNKCVVGLCAELFHGHFLVAFDKFYIEEAEK